MKIISKYGKSSITVLVKGSAQAKREKHASHISRVECIWFHLKQIIYRYKLSWETKTNNKKYINVSLWIELLKKLCYLLLRVSCILTTWDLEELSLNFRKVLIQCLSDHYRIACRPLWGVGLQSYRPHFGHIKI